MEQLKAVTKLAEEGHLPSTESSVDTRKTPAEPRKEGVLYIEPPTTAGKKHRKKAKKPRIVANVLNTEYDVVKDAMRKNLKFRLVYEFENDKASSLGDWDLYWHDIAISQDMLAKMRSYQKVNHFPGMECIARKNLLCRNLNRMKKMFPKDYNFFPATWSLPLEWSDFKKQFDGKAKTFIIKPEALSQGKGIYLTRKWETINPTEHCVAQRYVDKPFLMEGLKFDLRIYIMVYGCEPYRIFMYKEGLARLATEPYKNPNHENMDNQFMHLTNYAINKDNDNFEFNTDADKADVGHKRSLDFVWRYIEQAGGDAEKVQRSIRRCIIKTLCSVQPILAHNYRICQPFDLANDKCFEVLGFDILLDHKLRPWLLEVNHAPSFSTDTPFDYKIKAELLTDTFKLLNMRIEKRASFERKRLAKQQARLLPGKAQPLKLSKEERTIKKARKMAKRDRYEEENRGGYTRIYPELDADRPEYEKFIEAAQELWEDFTGAKKKRSDPPQPPAKPERKTVKLSPYAAVPAPVPKPRKPSSARPRAAPTNKPPETVSRTPDKSKKPPVVPAPSAAAIYRNASETQHRTVPGPSFTGHTAPNKEAPRATVTSLTEVQSGTTDMRTAGVDVVNVLKTYLKPTNPKPQADNVISGKPSHQSEPRRADSYHHNNVQPPAQTTTGNFVSTKTGANNNLGSKSGKPDTGQRWKAKELSSYTGGKLLINPSLRGSMGMYVVPKVVEFLPFDITTPMRDPRPERTGKKRRLSHAKASGNIALQQQALSPLPPLAHNYGFATESTWRYIHRKEQRLILHQLEQHQRQRRASRCRAVCL